MSRRLVFLAALFLAAVGGFVVAVLFVPKPGPPIMYSDPTIPSQSPLPHTLAKMKAATVFLEITDARGVVTTGTGWFGLQPNWLFTNAHVLGMLKPGSQPAAKITAFVHSGVTGKQVELPHAKLRVLAVDRDMDLALIEVLNPPVPMPTPLPVRPSANLNELHRLVVLGFPGGRRIAEKTRRTDPPAVSVSATSVAGLRRDSFDNLFAVQLSGGVLHGGSGSPVCDFDGNVVGVAVRVDLDYSGRLTGIGYAVPTEYVTGLVAGRAAGVTGGQGYVSGGKVAVPVTVPCHDPFKKLTAVGVVAWVGDADAAPRPPGATRPTPAPSDSDDTEVSLNYDATAQAATGDVTFPPLPSGRAYWVQPWFANDRVPRQYLAAVKLDAGGVPVRREAITLAVKYPAESKRTVSLTRVVELTDDDGSESAGWPAVLKYETTFGATERLSKSADGAAHPFARSWALESASTKRDRNGFPEPAPPALTAVIRKGLPGSGGSASQSAFGELLVLKAEPATAEISPFASVFLNGVQSVSIPLPNKSVPPLTTWQFLRDVKWSVPTEGFDEGVPLAPPVSDTTLHETVTYTYLGLRERDGAKQAVVSVAGTVAPPRGVPVAVSGSLWGEVTLDPDTGEVLAATVKRSFDLGFGPTQKRRWSGTEELTFRRGSAE